MSYAAEELTAASPRRFSTLGRLKALFKSILGRIDLSHFPGSCCS